MRRKLLRSDDDTVSLVGELKVLVFTLGGERTKRRANRECVSISKGAQVARLFEKVLRWL